jgi:uncharacterized membrane protein (TIGR02234 family)
VADRTPGPAETGDPESGRRRDYGRALLLLTAGGGALLLAYGMPWGWVESPLATGLELSRATVAVTGRDLFPVAGAAGWACLAGLVGVVATRSWGRRMVAAAVLCAGAVAVAVALAYGLSPTAFLQSTVAGGTGPAAGVVAAPTRWWMVSVAGGLAVAAMATWTMRSGRGWPVLGSRYERSGPRRLSAWQAQDLGQDPTDDLVE